MEKAERFRRRHLSFTLRRPLSKKYNGAISCAHQETDPDRVPARS